MVVVTEIGPDVALVGTVVKIWVEEKLVSTALEPLNLTTGVPALNPIPLMVTTVPVVPVVGEKLKIVGSTTKLLLEEICPAGAMIVMTPVVALVGSVAVICELVFTVKDVASVPLNLTAVAPRKFFPVMTIFVPG